MFQVNNLIVVTITSRLYRRTEVWWNNPIFQNNKSLLQYETIYIKRSQLLLCPGELGDVMEKNMMALYPTRKLNRRPHAY